MVPTIFLISFACSSLGSLPRFPYPEIQRLRQEFLGGQTVGLSYQPAAWDGMVEGKSPTGPRAFGQNPVSGNYETAFYIAVKNLSNIPVRVAAADFVIVTKSGAIFSASPITGSTSRPFPETELLPQASTQGYVVFEIPLDVLANDQLSTLQYDDGLGNRAVRYLSIPHMVQYEGLGSSVAELTEVTPPPPGEKREGQRWNPGHWENQWVPGRRYEGVWYPGRYETFWIEGRWE